MFMADFKYFNLYNLRIIKIKRLNNDKIKYETQNQPTIAT